MLKRIIAAVSIAVGGTASAQIVSAMFDVLDGADDGAPAPPRVLVLDGFVDVENVVGGAWTAAGIRCVTQNGATLLYADGDANIPGMQPALFNTGSANNRFVTMISRPRGRNALARFDNSGAVPAGDYDPTGPNPPTTTLTELNVAYFASPPMTSGDVGVDGYALRIAISIPSFIHDDEFRIGGPGGSPPGFPIQIARITGFDDGTPGPGWVNATYNTPTPVGRDFFVWGTIPEPATLVLLLLAAAAVRRR